MILDVIVDVNHSEVDKIFEYSTLDFDVALGSRVEVPFGAKKIEGFVVNVKETSNYPVEKIKPIIRLLEDIPALTEETLQLARYVSKTCYVTMANALRLFLPSEMRKGRIREKYTFFIELNIDCQLEVDQIASKLRKSAVKQKDLLYYLSENGKSELALVNKDFGQSAVKGLVDKGYAVISKEQYYRSPYKNLRLIEKNVTLTDAQAKAVEQIEKTDKQVSLIYGVTGSGKTEVYLKLISNVIAKGKCAVMMVPEIALTPQMLSQLRARFKENAAILHSGLSAGERFDEWWRIRSGKAQIVIGARSAIFAPVENVGIIIIDEEHDGSYVSESSPRYSTLDIAKVRAKYNQAKLVLGSATPQIESFLKAQNGEYELVTLTERINKKPLPKVEIADMRLEVRRGNSSPFSSILKQELEDCLNKGNQAILFLNQRGYSKSVICAECGHVQKCTSCDVSLTYHKEDDSLLCHYCGAKYKMIDACTECGSTYLRYGGFGTEKVVYELQKLFPKARILRMDRDTTANKEGHFAIIEKFAKKQADILVGTQMIAKGHDFPSVTLVGILDADMSLHFADYRSSERTFQLITQVAGRSGRAEEAGKVVLQTFNPENPVLMQSVKYDYLGFYNHEVSVRKATAFPPFTDIVRVLIADSDDARALECTRVIYERIQKLYLENKDKFRFFGCMKAPIKKLQNKFRYQIIMRIERQNANLLDAIYLSSKEFNNRNTSVYMELNPNNLS